MIDGTIGGHEEYADQADFTDGNELVEDVLDSEVDCPGGETEDYGAQGDAEILDLDVGSNSNKLMYSSEQLN